MRVSREQAAENRRRIVEAAARLFREQGFDGTGVDAIMRAAGLTHGGFYGQFESKDALAVEAMEQAIDRSLAWQEKAGDVAALVDAYLSPRHVADRGGGCAVAALAGETPRQTPAMKRTVTAGIRRQIDRIADLLKRGPATARRRHAIATYAGLVGALVLARAVDDRVLAGEILSAARHALGHAQRT
ncbi:TetR/AcrR family transcriptional regulator [Reyranella sp.]|uniref:TetR/AcrR family transcriptional regulator n=1 Tax=Reyranella sp. TaxID=1929291 RepID=UPI003BA9FD9F